jgi:hypothetical protein
MDENGVRHAARTMLPQSNLPASDAGGAPVISPFAQTVSTIRPPAVRARLAGLIWIVSAVLAMVVGGNAAYFGWKYLANPYRTLEPFSVDHYLADFQPLTGSKFGSQLVVVADLGWKEDVGRLMVFNAPNDNRPILVLVPPKLAGTYFSKGQTYQVAMEVGEGGLIYVDSCEKN